MRVTITGLTDSTIAFNTLGIVIRGKGVTNPGGCAYNIDIDTIEKQNEINSLVNAKLIKVETIKDHAELINVEMIKDRVVNNELAENSVNTLENIDDSDNEIEDCQSKPMLNDIFDNTKESETGVDQIIEINNETSSEENTNAGITIKNKRGRPKGSKNLKKENVVEKINNDKAVLKAKPVKKMSATLDEKTEVVIMTPDGPKHGHMEVAVYDEVSDRTKASLDAMEKLNEEENSKENQETINESELELQDRMGLKAIISSPNNGVESVTMKNCVIPEAEQIKNADANFIDNLQKNEIDVANDSFIDDLTNDDGLDFLEC
jgi:hypothetical protein